MGGHDDNALDVWHEKLEFLLEEEAQDADPRRRFQLRKNIAEARAKIVELGGKIDAPASPLSDKPRISISRLPSTSETFVGRENELARLDQAWNDDATNVLSFVAFGGVGKSALINQWLDRVQADGWGGAERVFGWSFYSQGTDATGASGDAFVEYALKWFGYQGEPIVSPWEKGVELARWVRCQRTLLVLDGLEPLQHPPGALTGRLKDPAVQALVKELMAENPGLCVITTRLAVDDIAGRAGTLSVDLEQLPPKAGAELLRQLGVKGPDAELEKTSEEFGGHGLALTLLGTYLRDICDGDVRRRQEVHLLDKELKEGQHAEKVMASYAAQLSSPLPLGEGLGVRASGVRPPPELQILRTLGLFDRPAEADAIAALRQDPIPDLTDGLDDETRWRKALARLRQARLIAEDDGDGVLDAHPLVREYFGDRLREDAPEAWRTGHERLYLHYKGTAEERPETLESLMPLYAAVVHGCRARRVQEACDEVYKDRILRGTEYFSSKKLGAFGAELTALAAFFDRPWDQPSAQLTAVFQAWILNQAGFVLRALGRLPEAVQPMRAGLKARIVEENWKEAALNAGNLSELNLTLGEVASAVQDGEESVELADRTDDAFERMADRTTLADALHQAGRWEESATLFREAEAMQAEYQPQYPRLYSLQGYQYCDLLLGQAEPDDGFLLVGQAAAGAAQAAARLAAPTAPDGRRSLPYKDRLRLSYRKTCEDVRERASQTLEWMIKADAPLLTIALDHLSLGRAHLGLALTSGTSPGSPQEDLTEAAQHLDRAVDGLRQAGQDQELPRGFLVRAALRRLRGDADASASDLREAEDIAVRGHMRLHEADVHLEWTRLRLQTGDHEDARRHLGRARELVTATGYGRREREITSLEASANAV